MRLLMNGCLSIGASEDGYSGTWEHLDRRRFIIMNQQTNAVYTLADCLKTENGHIQLKIPDYSLPDYLIEAFNASCSGDIDRAKSYLDETRLNHINHLIATRERERRIISLVVAMLWQRVGDVKQAVHWFEKTQAMESNSLVLNEIAVIYNKCSQMSKAIAYRQKALEMSPDDVGLWSNTSNDLMLLGRYEEALALLRRGIEKAQGNHLLHSNLLFMMQYLPGLSREELSKEAFRWGDIHAPVSLANRVFDNDPDVNRRLRIGYISQDFRVHSAAYNFESLLDGHDRHAFEIYGYGSVSNPDDVTRRFAEKFDQYRSIVELDDKAVSDLVQKDGIDILMIIGGHSGNHRLKVFAYKPAPIQVEFHGIGTSGIKQVDYRIADVCLDPPGTEKFYTEENVYLSSGFLCYKPPELTPPVGPLPAERNGFVTFGSFNNCLKINPQVLALWASILNRLETARLLMKFPGGHDSVVIEKVLMTLETYGIRRERVTTHNVKTDLQDHLNLYNEVDIALDPFPFQGCLTTLEGLWMGVPLISLVGDTFLARTSLSLLNQIELEQFAVFDAGEYLDKAVALAGNMPYLSHLRATMRERMMTSSLCDAKQHAEDIEFVCRQMWHRWCRSQGVDAPLSMNDHRREESMHE